MGKKSVKTYHRYTFASFFTGILCLAFLGIFALFLFMPAFSIETSSGVTEFNGLDMMIFGGGENLKTFMPDLVTNDFTPITDLFTGKTDNIVFGIIVNFRWIFEMIFAILFALSIVLGAIVAILGLFWIATGRLLFPKMSLIIARFSHSLFDAGVGVLTFYVTLCADFGKGLTDPATVTIGVFPWVTFGVQLAITIIMHITWRFSYRRREFDPNRKGTDEDGLTQKERAKQEEGMVPVYEKDVTAKGGAIPDHAYANDASLTKGTIPDGVTTLGNNAFANCRNLEKVTIPQTVSKIGSNCFNNTPNLKQIIYLGTKEDWRGIKRGNNWLVGAGTTTIVCQDGAIVVNPNS